MISVEEARRVLDASPKIQLQVETVALLDSVKRVLAEDQFAPFDHPPCDNSAMDGYALHTEDSANDTLTVAEGEIAAGTRPVLLPRPRAMKIFTGAPLPVNANVVVPVEQCEVRGNKLRILEMLHEGAHIRRKGMNFMSGEKILSRGMQIDSRVTALLSTLGRDSVPVYRKLRVSIATTGDELCIPGTDLEEGQIYDSNTAFLRQESTQAGFSLALVERLPDTMESVVDFLYRAAEQSDAIMFSGGISAGDKDYVRDMLEQEQCKVHFRKVAVKPGKPFTFASYRNTPLLCMPGNPLSVFIIFRYFALPFLQAMQGKKESKNSVLHLPSPQSMAAYPRSRFLFANSVNEGGQRQIELLPQQSSAAIQNLVLADGALIVPADTVIAKGQLLPYFPFS